jgi:carboxyl-terminal processing protease
MVISPLPDSPAEKAGLRPGDKIFNIDKESTSGMDVGAAVGKIRGKANTKVVLTIIREGQTKSEDVSITRSKINVPSVMFSVKENSIAYMRVMQFNEDTVPQMNKYIKQLKALPAKAIILDLRNNPGGYLDAAIEMGSQWITNGVVVSEKGKDGQSKDHQTFGQHPLAGIKTVVLVNKGSASASEIVAGALQDTKNGVLIGEQTFGQHPLAGIKTVVLVNKGSASASEIVAGALQDTKNGVLIGEQTFGKGSVQDFQTFPDGSALKLTIAEWFTPNGKNINKEGVKPDIEVKEDWENEKIGEDTVLSKAFEVIASSTFKW